MNTPDTGKLSRKRLWLIVALGFTVGILIALNAPEGKTERGTSANGLVVLLTDFGAKDFYVGAMKGAIYSVFPAARIDSISHEVTPFDISQGAYTLAKASAEFPAGTVFVVVVDPGVGTPRKPIVMQTEDGKYFVAPDNGILTMVANSLGVAEVREIQNTDLMRGGALSSTFHGRDIFGPTGAHLASGTAFGSVGEVVKNYHRLDLPLAERTESSIVGRIELIDEYGNALTNIPRTLFGGSDIVLGDKIVVSVGDPAQAIEVKYVNTYGDVPVGEYIGLFGSGEVLELAINQGNLGSALKLQQGDRVLIEW